MSEGLVTRHPVSGGALLDTTTGMVRILGSVTTTPNVAGSVTGIGAFSAGSPFAVSYAQGIPDIELSQTYPVHAISGSTVSWNAAPLAATIIYGVYAGSTPGVIGTGQIGFRAINSNQATQIDSYYANHALLQQGAVNIPSGGTQSITLTCSLPLLAYRGTRWVTVLEQLKNSDGTWTLVLGAAVGAATVGTYYIFDTVQASSLMYATNTGLQVRHGVTGAVLYDSRLRYMRIVQIRANAADGWVPARPQTTALSQDNLAAIVDPGLWFNQTTRQSEDPSGVPIFTDVYSPYFVGAGVSGATLTEGSITSGSESPVVPGDVQQGTTILIDVSNF